MIEFMKRFALNQYKVCQDIDARKIHGFKPPIQQNKRQRIRIAVIDDQPFEAGNLLRNYGYAIEEKGDVKKLNEIEDYPVILCDLMNVGMFFDTDAQGASLIKEIRRNYPAKYIAAYSGASATLTQAQRAKQHADTFIKKDSEIESWVEKLDDLISDATDPRKVWLRTRAAMVSEQIDTKTILLLEDAYVESVVNANPDLSRLRKIINEENIASAAKNIVLGLASSAIFEALK